MPRRGDLQNLADRLDPAGVAMTVDEIPQDLSRRSSSRLRFRSLPESFISKKYQTVKRKIDLHRQSGESGDPGISKCAAETHSDFRPILISPSEIWSRHPAEGEYAMSIEKPPSG
jgi:hypothetical protein